MGAKKGKAKEIVDDIQEDVKKTSSEKPEIETSPHVQGRSFFSRIFGKVKQKHQQKVEEIETAKLTDEETKIVEEKVEEANRFQNLQAKTQK